MAIQFLKPTQTEKVEKIHIGTKLFKCKYFEYCLYLQKKRDIWFLIKLFSYFSFLPPGVNKIYVEVYDECSFTMDELIAWGHIDIPCQVVEKGTTYEDWYLLSGKQGDNQEGSINLVLSYQVY